MCNIYMSSQSLSYMLMWTYGLQSDAGDRTNYIGHRLYFARSRNSGRRPFEEQSSTDICSKRSKSTYFFL